MILLGLSIILGVIIIIYNWKNNREGLSRRAAEFRADLNQYKKADQAYDTIHSRAYFLMEAPGATEKIFTPPPAIAGRVQSTQYEHLVAEGPLIDIDYQTTTPWPIVKPVPLTRQAFVNATSHQIDSMKRMLEAQLKSSLEKTGLMFEFDSIFTEQHRKDHRVMANWPAGNVDLKSLTTYQSRMSDQLFEAVKNLIATANISISAVVTHHGILVNTLPVGVRHLPGQRAPVQFQHSNHYKLDGHQLLKVDNVLTTSVDNQKLISIAQQHVQSIYSDLKDQYQYLIDEMDDSVFATEIPTVMSVGNEMVFDYIQVDQPTLSQLDAFGSNVKDAMRESLFEILLKHNIDIDQYSDVSSPNLVGPTVDVI